MKEDFNVCMECGFDWEENNAISCRNCGSGDFYTEKEEENEK